MRVLTVHNFYQQPGGEDTVFHAEAELLRAAGHDVHKYSVSNDSIPAGARLRVATNAVWNRTAYATIRRLVRQHSSEVVHFHNTFPVLSPAVFQAARRAGAAVVVSLHNTRFMCPAASFFREGRPCMDCFGKPFAWPGVLHGCYRNSRAQTAVNAAVTAVHRLIGTWAKDVDRYVVFTEYHRELFERAGLPSAKLFVKPHFVTALEMPEREDSADYALYAGRLDREKGVQTLVQAFELAHERSPDASPPLYVCGDGPLRDAVQRSLELGRIRGKLLGWVPRAELHALMARARFLVWPSEGSESFGLVAAEALACGIPVLASDAGGAPYVVPTEAGGLYFRSGDAEDLARRVAQMSRMPSDTIQEMRVRARRVFEERYSPRANLRLMEELYHQAIAARERGPYASGGSSVTRSG